MRIVTVLGARPQFVEASVVSVAMAKHGGMGEVVVHTGQHFDTSPSEMFFKGRQACSESHQFGWRTKGSAFYGVPYGTLYDETEWVEVVEAGWYRLALHRGDDRST